MKCVVIHRHRVGARTFCRVSEMVFIRGRPKAILDWIDMGAGRTPVYLDELESSRLKGPPRGAKGVYFYDGETVDPRFADMRPLPGAKHPDR
jgi:hypothetical protein